MPQTENTPIHPHTYSKLVSEALAIKILTWLSLWRVTVADAEQSAHGRVVKGLYTNMRPELHDEIKWHHVS